MTLLPESFRSPDGSKLSDFTRDKYLQKTFPNLSREEYDQISAVASNPATIDMVWRGMDPVKQLHLQSAFNVLRKVIDPTSLQAAKVDFEEIKAYATAEEINNAITLIQAVLSNLESSLEEVRGALKCVACLKKTVENGESVPPIFVKKLEQIQGQLEQIQAAKEKLLSGGAREHAVAEFDTARQLFAGETRNDLADALKGALRLKSADTAKAQELASLTGDIARLEAKISQAQTLLEKTFSALSSLEEEHHVQAMGLSGEDLAMVNEFYSGEKAPFETTKVTLEQSLATSQNEARELQNRRTALLNAKA